MHNLKMHHIAVLVAVAAVLALLAGFHHIDPAFLGAIGMLPLGVGSINGASLAELIEEQGKQLDVFIKKQDTRLGTLEKEFGGILKKHNRAPAGFDFSERSDPDHKQAFNRFLRKGDDSGLDEIQRKAMNTGSDPEGGYLVLPEMDATIDRIAPTVSAMFRLANVVTTASAKWEKLVKTAGMAMRRVADGSGGGETVAPTYAKITIDVHTAEVEPWVHNETLEDAFVDLATDLADEAGTGFAEGAGAEFITGDGVAGARGILDYPTVANSAYAWGSVGYILSGKSAAFTSVAPADAVVNLVSSLPSRYRQGASFLMNDSTLNIMRQMKDGSGSYYLWQPDPTAPFGGKLLGFPVEVDDNMPALGAGSFSLAFGDFKRGYTIVNRTGTTLIRDNITTKGKTKFNFRRRFGGGVTHFEAVKLMKFATS